jgi:hypothetical protein
MYPRMIYHATAGLCIVQNAAEHQARLKDGWQDQPIPAAAPEPEGDPVGDRIAALEARVDALEQKKKR